MSEVFDKALGFVLAHEGGFVDDPADPGGATNFGISLRYILNQGDGNTEIFDKDGDGDIDADDVELFSLADASTVYQSLWDKRGLEQIADPSIAAKIFDLMVLCGFKGASRIVQRALNACQNPVVIDGVMGSKTLEAINETPPYALLCAIGAEAAGYLRSLNKPRFEKGWVRRAYDHPPVSKTQ